MHLLHSACLWIVLGACFFCHRFTAGTSPLSIVNRTRYKLELSARAMEGDAFRELIEELKRSSIKITGFYHSSNHQPFWKDVIKEQLSLLDGKRMKLDSMLPYELYEEKSIQYENITGIPENKSFSSLLTAIDKLHMTFSLDVNRKDGKDFQDFLDFFYSSDLAIRQKDKIDIYVNYTVPRHANQGLINQLEDIHKMNLTCGEMATIMRLHSYCSKEVAAGREAIVFYFHTKSAAFDRSNSFYEKNQPYLWREFMNTFNIEFPSLCIAKIFREGYSTCGVNYRHVSYNQRNKFPPHYSGNFWWASCDYVASLPSTTKSETYDAYAAEWFISNVHSSFDERRQFAALHSYSFVDAQTYFYTNYTRDHYINIVSDNLNALQKPPPLKEKLDRLRSSIELLNKYHQAIPEYFCPTNNKTILSEKESRFKARLHRIHKHQQIEESRRSKVDLSLLYNFNKSLINNPLIPFNASDVISDEQLVEPIYKTSVSNCNYVCRKFENKSKDVKEAFKNPAQRALKLGYRDDVDVFFLFLCGKPNYVKKGLFWILPHIALKYSRVNSKGEFDTRIHIVSDCDSILKTAEVLGYQGYDVRPFLLKNKEFVSKIEELTTSVEYLVTLWRWKMYNSIVQEWNSNPANSEKKMTRILALDGDVLMLKNVPEFWSDVILTVTPWENSNDGHAVIDSQFEMIDISLGAIVLLTPKGLSGFSDFIDRWFAAPDVKEKSARFGKHLSDMALQALYMEERPKTRNSCFEMWGTGHYDSIWKKVERNKCLLESLTCIPQVNFRDMGRGLNLHLYYLNDGLFIRGSGEDLPYCLMHFQGWQFKSYMYLYGKIFDYFVNAKSNSNSSLLINNKIQENLHGGLLIQRSGTRELYYVNSRGLKYQVKSMKDFDDKNFTYDFSDIIGNVPDSVLSIFPQTEEFKFDD